MRGIWSTPSGTTLTLNGVWDGTRIVPVREIQDDALPDGTRDAALHPFSVQSPWNTPIGSDATYAADDDATSLSLLSVPGDTNRLNWSVRIVYATLDDPFATVTFLDGVSGIPPRPIRIPRGTVPPGGTDGWVCVVQPDRRSAWDFYAFTPDGTDTYRTPYWTPIDLCGSGIDGGTRASVMALMGGQISPYDLAKGSIDHALAIGLDYSQLVSGYVWPAEGEDALSEQYSGSIPMGSLLAIPPSVDVTELGLTTSYGLMIAHALQDYGAYITHSSATVSISFDPSIDAAIEIAALPDYRDSIKDLLRVVTNNTPTTVGGGGTPRVPLLPEPIRNFSPDRLINPQ